LKITKVLEHSMTVSRAGDFLPTSPKRRTRLDRAIAALYDPTIARRSN